VNGPRVAVIGGGVSGLTAAFHLEQQGFEVTVFEASDTVGGKLSSSAVEGIDVEEGADSFLPRNDEPLELCRELGLGELTSPAVFGAYIWRAGRLRRLPSGSPYGIPRSPKEAWRAGLLTAPGALRAAAEVLAPRPLRGDDVSIGGFVRARFGRQVLENLVDPLLAGVRGGRANQVSLAAAAREVDALARSERSLLRALRAQGAPETPRFIAPSGGMRQLTDALAARLRSVQRSAPVLGISKGDNTLSVRSSTGEHQVDGLVLAVPAFVASEIVSDLDPATSGLLSRIDHASVAVITLVYPEDVVTIPADGSGFLVPSDAGLTMSACTWYSTKWPSEALAGRTVLRAVVGRAGRDPSLSLSDEGLTDRVQRDLAATMGLSHTPLGSKVTRWERAIPQYAVGHLDLVTRIESNLAETAPIVIAGASYRGSGIPDCISQANRAAAALADRLSTRRG
jgi:protoporphyrinogen/coproporphyrinogen III oxidase